MSPFALSPRCAHKVITKACKHASDTSRLVQCACATVMVKSASRRACRACSQRVQWCASELSGKSGRTQLTTRMILRMIMSLQMTMHRNPLRYADRLLQAALVVGVLLPWVTGGVARAADDV